jgi:hypothetical protein
MRMKISQTRAIDLALTSKEEISKILPYRDLETLPSRSSLEVMMTMVMTAKTWQLCMKDSHRMKKFKVLVVLEDSIITLEMKISKVQVIRTTASGALEVLTTIFRAKVVPSIISKLKVAQLVNSKARVAPTTNSRAIVAQTIISKIKVAQIAIFKAKKAQRTIISEDQVAQL